jgi:hypothetical protein
MVMFRVIYIVAISRDKSIHNPGADLKQFLIIWFLADSAGSNPKKESIIILFL